MPERVTKQRAHAQLRRGKRPTTAAGEFVREEMHHIRGGKHGARSPKQAIAIGLSKARRAGVPLAPPAAGQATERTRRSAKRDVEVGQGRRQPRAPSPRRSRAIEGVLKRESRASASRGALAGQARSAAARRRRTGATQEAGARTSRRPARAQPRRRSGEDTLQRQRRTAARTARRPTSRGSTARRTSTARSRTGRTSRR